MDYKRNENEIFLRIDRGEEVLEKILEVVKKENIKSGNMTAIGACDEFTVGLYSVSEQKYYSKHYKGEFEIVSFLGNISQKDGMPYIHVHIGCSGEDHIVIGGHLNRCHISGTFECKIEISNVSITRKIDSKTGLNVFNFDN
ncbi:MAG: DNA-binding protein [Bacilli bacterium]|nr:DNA-binding protein [Bacilli bacterium]